MKKGFQGVIIALSAILLNGAIMEVAYAVPVPPPVHVPYHTDPDFNITDSNRRLVFANRGEVNVIGNNDTVVIRGHCDEIKVIGHDNTIVIRECAYAHISGHNNNLTIHGDCNGLDSLGAHNSITVDGHCGSLDVYSTGNTARVSVLDHLLVKDNHHSINLGQVADGRIEGHDNTVIYQHGIGRGSIKVSQRFKVSGQRNTVRRIP